MAFLGDLTSGSQQRNADIMGVNFAQGIGNQNTAAIQAGQTGALGALQGAYGLTQDQLAGTLPSSLYELGAGYQQGGAAFNQMFGGQTAAIMAGLQGGMQQYQTGLSSALDALYGGAQQGMGLIGQGYGQAQGDISQALQSQIAAINQGYGQGESALRGQIGQYNPWIQSGQASTGMLANALGLGGAAGNQAAQGAFQAGPGYQWQLNQGLEAVKRGAAATGGVTGNTLTALQNTGNQLANQSWNQWLGNLGSTANTGLNALGGQSGVVGSLANMYAGQGGALSGVYGSAGTQLANLAAQQGQLQGQMAYGAGQQAAGLDQSAYANMAAAQMNQNNLLGQAYGNAGQYLGNMNVNYGSNIANMMQGTAAQQAQYAASLMGTAPASQYDYFTGQQVASNNAQMNAILPLIQQGGQAGAQASANDMNLLLGGLGLAGKLGGMSLGGGQTLAGSLFGGIGSLFSS